MALIIAFVAAITNGETPLNVLQLLWVNLIMDSLAALGELMTAEMLLGRAGWEAAAQLATCLLQQCHLTGLPPTLPPPQPWPPRPPRPTCSSRSHTGATSR